MSRLRYFEIDGGFILSELLCDEGEEALLVFSEIFDATLVIGDYICEVTDGRCTLELSRLLDGTVSPYLIRDKRRFDMESFGKHGRIIELLPLSEGYIRALLEENLGDRKRLTALEEATEHISDKIEHSTIF